MYYLTRDDGTAFQETSWDGTSKWLPPEGWTVRGDADFASWKAGHAAAAPLLRQDTLIVLTRLTDAEDQALHNAEQSDYRVAKFSRMAQAAKVIDQSDPNYAAGVAYLDQLGIIAASRWATLLAP